MEHNVGWVALVGAGCGPADWITLRGARRLEQCTALVYDDLIDPALLDWAPQAVRCYMGKRQGAHSASQEEISRLLIRLAQAGHRVVRLKGGDPFVFGRGGEEALALQAAGIPWEVVPGITSPIAIPGQSGIPVTHRGLSQSLHIITAHTADTPDGLPANLDQLARLPGTLVFLMGLSRLPLLMDRLQGAGMDPETPAAVCSGGNAPHPRTVRGTLSNLARRTQAAGVQPPAVILVGRVGALDLKQGGALPLAGVTVGVTGTDRFARQLTEALQDRGARTVRMQRVSLEPIQMDLAWLEEEPAPWLVFTSANGVECFFDQMKAQRRDLRQLARCRFAVIGPATGGALEKRGIYPDLCPSLHTTQALGDLLLARLPRGSRVVLLRSQEGDPDLARRLEGVVSLTERPLYRVQASLGETPPEGPDYLVFGSAGGVRSWFQRGGRPAPETVCVAIGPVTARALETHWKGPRLTAPRPSVEALVETILDHRGSP